MMKWWWECAHLNGGCTMILVVTIMVVAMVIDFVVLILVILVVWYHTNRNIKLLLLFKKHVWKFLKLFYKSIQPHMISSFFLENMKLENCHKKKYIKVLWISKWILSNIILMINGLGLYPPKKKNLLPIEAD